MKRPPEFRRGQVVYCRGCDAYIKIKRRNKWGWTANLYSDGCETQQQHDASLALPQGPNWSAEYREIVTAHTTLRGLTKLEKGSQ